MPEFYCLCMGILPAVYLCMTYMDGTLGSQKMAPEDLSVVPSNHAK